MRIHDETIYCGDNGRLYCGEHLGMTARATGRDLSGQRILRCTPDEVRGATALGFVLRCEQPGCGRTASALHTMIDP